MSDAPQPSGLQEGLSHLTSAHDELASLLDVLKGELNSSIDGWDDSSRSAYEEAKLQWDQAAQRQRDLIRTLHPF